MNQLPSLAVVIPAAGVGSRMGANKAKQYLSIGDKTILEHTVTRFSELDFVSVIYLSIADSDEVFNTLDLLDNPKVRVVPGGVERADSVLNGVIAAERDGYEWLMVHDAARPCVSERDVTGLYQQCTSQSQAGILATPVRDTMKRAQTASCNIDHTIDRSNMWHAQTPQCAKVSVLKSALQNELQETGLISKKITDEASALELAGVEVALVEGSVKNIKITLPEDLELAEFYLSGKNK